jgi:hypothetical protein
MNDSKDFYDKYKSLVYNLALNYSANKEYAEEITQINISPYFTFIKMV